MKPTEKQVEVIKEILGIIKSWEGTNDINSPTHYGDINEELNKLELDTIITCPEETKLTTGLAYLLSTIQDL